MVILAVRFLREQPTVQEILQAGKYHFELTVTNVMLSVCSVNLHQAAASFKKKLLSSETDLINLVLIKYFLLHRATGTKCSEPELLANCL